MSIDKSLPIRVPVYPNEYALSADLNNEHITLGYYLNNLVAGLLGEFTGNTANQPSVGISPLGCIVHGCDVQLNPTNPNQLSIAGGLALFRNSAPDNLVTSLAFVGLVDPDTGLQTTNIPLGIPLTNFYQTNDFYAVVVLELTEVQLVAPRLFRIPQTGLDASSNVVVLRGAAGVPRVITIPAGSTEINALARIPVIPPNCIPVAAIYFKKNTGLALSAARIFDIRPTTTGSLPSVGGVDFSAAYFTDDHARISFQPKDAQRRTPRSTPYADQGSPEWYNPVSRQKENSLTCAVRLGQIPFTAASNDVPPLNVIFDDGSYRRTALLDAGGSLTPVGPLFQSTFSILQSTGLRLFYVVHGIDSNGISVYMIVTDPSIEYTLESLQSDTTGALDFPFNFLGSMPPPFRDVLRANVVGVLPIFAPVSGPVRFPKFVFSNNKLTFLESIPSSYLKSYSAVGFPGTNLDPSNSALWDLEGTANSGGDFGLTSANFVQDSSVVTPVPGDRVYFLSKVFGPVIPDYILRKHLLYKFRVTVGLTFSTGQNPIPLFAARAKTLAVKFIKGDAGTTYAAAIAADSVASMALPDNSETIYVEIPSPYDYWTPTITFEYTTRIEDYKRFRVLITAGNPGANNLNIIGRRCTINMELLEIEVPPYGTLQR